MTTSDRFVQICFYDEIKLQVLNHLPREVKYIAVAESEVTFTYFYILFITESLFVFPELGGVNC